jgi:hypothetical protein
VTGARSVSRLTVVSILIALFATMLAIIAPAATASPHSGGGGGCDPTHGTCGVGVGSPGSPGGPGTGGGGGGNGGGGGGGPTSPGCHNTDPSGNGCDPCNTLTTGIPSDRNACEIYSQNLFCSELNPQGLTYEQWENELQQLGCAGNTYNPGSPAVAAQKAYKSITFPKPSGDRSPSQDQLYRGYPFTYTGLWTWWWTGKDTWKTLTATATDGNQSATVTAKPVALVFDPGDGSSAVRCSGPGRPWTSADANNAPSDGGCAYQYHQVTSSPITSTQSIVWEITWKGTGNSSGTIPQLTTSTSGQLNVMQIQTVVTR